MEYISAEELLKQPTEVQKVFVDWWQPTKFDIVYDVITRQNTIITSLNNKLIYLYNYGNICERMKFSIIPLFVEGQLRQFIEEKTSKKIDIEIRNENVEVTVWGNTIPGGMTVYNYVSITLIDAFWQVACKIALEEVRRCWN